MRNPIQQETTQEARQKANQMRKIQVKTSISEREKRKIEQIAEALPDSVIVPEPEEPEQPSLLTDEIMHDLGGSLHTVKQANQRWH